MPYKDKERQKESVRKRQNQLRDQIHSFKESNPCVDCGNFYPYYVMQFDHLRDKKFAVGIRSASYGSAYFNAEMEKCDIVCANCHAIRTYQRRRS
jgi:hypothetical protein